MNPGEVIYFRHLCYGVCEPNCNPDAPMHKSQHNLFTCVTYYVHKGINGDKFRIVGGRRQLANDMMSHTPYHTTASRILEQAQMIYSGSLYIM